MQLAHTAWETHANLSYDNIPKASLFRRDSNQQIMFRKSLPEVTSNTPIFHTPPTTTTMLEQLPQRPNSQRLNWLMQKWKSDFCTEYGYELRHEKEITIWASKCKAISFQNLKTHPCDSHNVTAPIPPISICSFVIFVPFLQIMTN